VPVHEAGGKGRVAKGRGADHGAGGAAIENLRHGGVRAKPAGDLAPDTVPDALDDPPHGLDVRPLPCPRAVEVDDVEPLGAVRRECLRDGCRIIAVRRLLVEVALTEPDDSAVPEVDRREQRERLVCRPCFSVVAF
jgi:hypothetical protein